jgi:hypothetical protein
MNQSLSLILHLCDIEANSCRWAFVIANKSFIQDTDNFYRLFHFFFTPTWVLAWCSFISDNRIFFIIIIRPERIGWREKNAKQNLPFIRIRLSLSNVYVRFCIFVLIIINLIIISFLHFSFCGLIDGALSFLLLLAYRKMIKV